MGSQSAGEQAVAVGILDNVAAVQAGAGEGADHRFLPDLDIFFRVGDDDRFPRGAGGSV